MRGGLPITTAEQAYVKAQFRESRNVHGDSTYLDFEQRVNQIAEMPLYDLDSDQLITVHNLGLI